MATELFANNYAVQLASGCAAGDSTITVKSAAPTALQGGQFRILIDQEYMLVTGGQSGTTWNVSRGSATGEIPTPTAVSHSNGSWATHVVTAASINAFAALGSIPVFNITSPSYGAILDGVTDNSTAVQAAYTAAGNAGGGIVLFPPGGCVMQDVSIPSGNIITMGCGWASQIIQAHNASDNHYALSANPGSGGTSNPAQNMMGLGFFNIQFYGQVDVYGFEQEQFLLNLNAVSRVTVSNCLFSGFRGDGIYLGSSNAANTERHNEHIKILGCTFDGLNQENRNCISIIDGNDVLIDGCTFQNSSNNTMPGAIDMEPNNSFGRIVGIKIKNSLFDNILGNAGVISYFMTFTQAALTTPSDDIIIEGNTIRNSSGAPAGILMQQQQTATQSTTPNRVQILNNRIDNSGEGVEIDGLRDVTIQGNKIANQANAGIALGFGSGGNTPTSVDINVFDNTLSLVGTGGSVNDAITVYRIINLRIRGNTFDNIGLQNGSFGNVIHLNQDGNGTGTSDTIEFADNTIVGSTATSLWYKGGASHTIASTARNRSYNNITGGYSVDQTLATPGSTRLVGTATYNPGTVTNGSSVTTTVTVHGAAVGDAASMGHTTLTSSGWTFAAVVSSASTVSVKITNNTGGSLTPGSGTLMCVVDHISA